ncbi:hypothetical protein [Moraxella bovis]|uniref:Uncharacterized protein n=1 Tax=Moraxella bovis TaxID=476 RepID=A0ABY6M4K0_MORBO|nr:hypothetical protein [Moraxella bovis]UZA02088.1 hypothetical protein LP092_08760 [Moraxella bovis]UZA36473.1 hypothetical protein LP098_05765 [Moraxella bovis]
MNFTLSQSKKGLSTSLRIDFGVYRTQDVKPNTISPFGISPFVVNPHSVRHRFVQDGRIKQDFVFQTTINIPSLTKVDFVFGGSQSSESQDIIAGMGNQLAIPTTHHIYRLRDFIQNVSVGDVQAFGRVKITNKNQTLYTRTWISHKIGNPTLINKTQEIKVTSLATGWFGLPSVSPRFIYVRGFLSESVASPSILNSLQFVKAIGIESHQFGQARLVNHRRFLPVVGFDAHTVSRPTIWYGKRPVVNHGFVSSQFGVPSLLGGVRYVAPKGISHKIIYRLDYPSPSHPTFGVADDINSTPYKNTSSIQYERYLSVVSDGMFGVSEVGNKNQVIRPEGIDGAVFGLSLVATPIRHVYLQGWQSDRFGYVPKDLHTWHNPSDNMLGLYRNSINWQSGLTVWYKKRPIFPKSITQNFVSTPFIAHRVRLIQAQGFVSEKVGTALLNRPESLQIRGWLSSGFGQSRLVNTKQFHLITTGFKAEAFGVASLSPRMLYPKGIDDQIFGTLKVGWGKFQGFDSQAFGYHRISLYAQVIHTQSFTSERFGETFLRQAQIAPEGIFHNIFGDVRIYNRNRTIYPSSILPNPLSTWATIKNRLSVISPNGIHAPDFYPPSIDNLQRYLAPYGFSFTAFGYHQVFHDWQFHRSIFVTGFASDSFGQASIANKNQYIKTGNLYPPNIPKPIIELRNNYIAPNGIESLVFGVGVVDFYHRTLTVKGVASHLTIGRIWISYHTRIIAPASVDNIALAKPTVGTSQYISPIGFVATRWLTRIIPEIQVIYPKGFGGKFGHHRIKNHRQYGQMSGFNAEEFGQTHIYNLRQYIHVVNDEQSELSPNGKQKGFGQWINIFNKNRVIAAFGFRHDIFGRATLSNKAVLVEPIGFDGLDLGNIWVSDKIRYVVTNGINPPPISHWHIIYNDAREIYTKEFANKAAFGGTIIANTRRILTGIGGFDVSVFGQPMIADKIRTIDIEWRYAITPPAIPLPSVHLYTRYITPKGFDGANRGKFGLSDVIERFNIVKPRWAYKPLFGVTHIKNLTPEIPIFGHDSQEFGHAFVRNEFRHIYPKNHESLVMGRPTIKDRRQKIEVLGFGGIKIGTHRIIKEILPYHPQWIDLNRYNDKDEPIGGYGIKSTNTFGHATMSERAIIVRSFGGEKFGLPSLRDNKIQPQYGIFEDEFGNATVWIKTQYVNIQKGIVGQTSFGKPRLSPHTIYAPLGDKATSQARVNHTPVNYHRINSMVEFGHTVVSNQHRSVRMYGAHHELFGSHLIKNKLIVIKPFGFRLSRFGIPMIPFVPQHIQVRHSVQETIIGWARVSRPEILISHITPKGFAGEIGKHIVSNLHRTIYAKSFMATQMGRSIGGDTPFMWQGLRIGERVLGSYGGFDSSTFGGAWISNKIREVRVDGFDSFVSESDIKSFKGRLTVKRAIDGLPQKNKQPQAIGAVGIAPPTVPVPNIKNKVHYIRPDGNSEQFRKGAWIYDSNLG